MFELHYSIQINLLVLNTIDFRWYFFWKMGNHPPLFHLVCLFKKCLSSIRYLDSNHDHLDMSLIPWPLDQGCCPFPGDVWKRNFLNDNKTGGPFYLCQVMIVYIFEFFKLEQIHAVGCVMRVTDEIFFSCTDPH